MELEKMDSFEKCGYLIKHLTDDDVAAWHDGELTPHLEELLDVLGLKEVSIWGSRTGLEPLSVTAP